MSDDRSNKAYSDYDFVPVMSGHVTCSGWAVCMCACACVNDEVGVDSAKEMSVCVC